MQQRLTCVVLVMLVAASAQVGLWMHLHGGSPGAKLYAEMGKSFKEIPKDIEIPTGELGKADLWIGQWDDKNTEKVVSTLPFRPDDIFMRQYDCPSQNIGMQVYLVHSKTGEDRKHHPEICIAAVQGYPEVKDGREKFDLSGAAKLGRFAQRFRFLKVPSDQVATVYYWHYTFKSNSEGLAPLQQINQTFARPGPSVTAQVWTVVGVDQLPLVEKFLAALDKRLRTEHLPADAFVGCDRIPIGLIR